MHPLSDRGKRAADALFGCGVCRRILYVTADMGLLSKSEVVTAHCSIDAIVRQTDD